MGETTLESEGASSAELRVGRVFSRAFGIYRRHIAIFFTLMAIVTSPALILFDASFETAIDTAMESKRGSVVNGPGLALALSFLLQTFGQAVVLFGAFQDMRGRPVNLAESLKKGLARFFPVIGASIGNGVAVTLATLLLVIPGLIVASMLFVAIPACVVEQTGPFESLGRSAYLTKGHRWKVLGVLLVLVLVGESVAAIIAAILSRLDGGALVGIADYVWRAFFGAFQAIVIVVLYHDLRVVKEGIDTERIAAVFD